ncbi:hypothetical protein K3495_g3492 [Podosphaera aphanis]|nr:hypothetical protein K3495_g3492 [Podosphaera aphanis]
MPPFKDEHILIIAPGSQTTLAQLGLPESFTPASHRFPTRMFKAPDGKTWEPYRVCERPKKQIDGDVASSSSPKSQEMELVEFMDEDEGAVWPLKEGRIENMPAFFALLQHIYNTFSPSLHTPVLLVAQPCWTSKNHEDITQFVFEKFKTPGLCIIDSALATTYAFGVANATVIDVGFEKTDVTAISNFVISARGTVAHSGGEAMTRRLVEVLKSKDFSRDMAEQLKKSPICEILPPGIPLPGTSEAAAEEQLMSNPATVSILAASTGVGLSGSIPKFETRNEESILLDDKPVEDDGVLDIASIVTSGKTQDFLAKKEKEKAERAAARKATRDAEKAEAAAVANKPARLPNSKRPIAIFHYDQRIKGDAVNAKSQKTPEPQIVSTSPEQETTNENPTDNPTTTDIIVNLEDEAERRELQKNARKEERRKVREEENPGLLRKEIEIGIERFQAASTGYMDTIADTVYRTILSIEEIPRRQEAWDSLIICGNGSKVRGFKEALLITLSNRYLVSPNVASLTTSELPSNLGTPSGNGAMTPNPSYPTSLHAHAHSNSSAANPLLLAATTSSIPAYNSNNPSNPPQAYFCPQSPTSIKVVSPPSYFPEWKHYEEAVFLGSQVAAKVFFVNDQGQSKAFLTRMEFNEDGPTAIHQV